MTVGAETFGAMALADSGIPARAEPAEKFLLAAGTALIALTLWGFVAIFGQSKSVTLYSG